MTQTDGSDAPRKHTWAFRWWWFRHRRHLLVKHPYGTVWCAKCLIPAPYPFRDAS